jgi:argininosuccinate lyase
LADYLVRKGLTFRDAHEVSGKMVLYAMEQSQELHKLTIPEMQRFSRQIDEDVYEWLEPESCIRRRTIAGGTGFETVAERVRAAKEELGL